VRSRDEDDAVRRAPAPAYVVVGGSCLDERLMAGMDATGIPFMTERVGDWNLVVPERRVLPEDVVAEPC
jgi:hypothetical protein